MRSLGLLLFVLALLIGAGFWLRHSPSEFPAPPRAPTSVATPSDSQAESKATPVSSGPVSEKPGPSDKADWKKLSDLLQDNTLSHAQVAQKLLQLIRDPRSPDDLRIDALEHTLNLVTDADFPRFQADLLSLAREEKLRAAVLQNLHERPDTAKLPALVELIRQSDHPLTEEARSTLSFLLQADHGTDATAWQQALSRQLSKP